MRAGVIVLPEPSIDDDLGLFSGGEPLRVENLAAQVPLKRSLYPFSQGEPG